MRSSTGLSGEPCRTPLDWSMLVSWSRMNQQLPSFQQLQPCSGFPRPSTGAAPPRLSLPTRVATNPPMDSCHTESKAFLMSNFTTHVGTASPVPCA